MQKKVGCVTAIIGCGEVFGIDAGDDEYKEVVEFTIDYDAAKDFRNNRGEMLRQNQWKDLTVRVMI